MKQRLRREMITLMAIVAILSILATCKGKESSFITADDFTQTTDLIRQLRLANTPEYSYQVLQSSSHTPNSFTEGLVLEDGVIYESTGLYGQSILRKTDQTSGKLIQSYKLPNQYFGEGISTFGSHLYQLTYREGTGFVYDKNTFQLERTFNYSSEGWGLTADKQHLIMSNGSATLSYLDPITLKQTRQLTVMDNNHRPIQGLNELEYVDGEIYANIYPTPVILIISADSGLVKGWLTIQSLQPRPGCPHDTCVANGVAYNKEHHTLYVTGKNWPQLYELKLMPK